MRGNGPAALRVLYICTGNVCRSPMAELLFRSWVPSDQDVDISSAGMQALVGHGVDGPSASALWQLGINPASHRARQFDTKMAAGQISSLLPNVPTATRS